MKTLARRLLLGTAIVSAGVLGGATAAHAEPTSCDLETGVPRGGANVWCSGGDGEARVGIQCALFKPGSDPIITARHGPWVTVQATSSAACPLSHQALWDAWYEVRD
jgi:hypothetical protein